MDIKEVQYLLGHSRPTMTMDIYVHYMAQARQEDTARKIEKAFSAPILAVAGQ
jgi:integrase